MTRHQPRSLRALIAAMLTLALAGPALAAGEQGAGNDDGGAAAGAAAEVTDAELKQFAEAFGQIRSVRAEYGPRIQQAESKQQRNELKKQGRQDMVAAIQDAGLKVAEYRQIGQRLNGDKALQQRLRELMREERGNAQGGSGQQSGSGQQ